MEPELSERKKGKRKFHLNIGGGEKKKRHFTVRVIKH